MLVAHGSPTVVNSTGCRFVDSLPYGAAAGSRGPELPRCQALGPRNPPPSPPGTRRGVRTARSHMSQRSVERVIGRLVTDEAFRRRFAEDSESALRETMECGLELNPCERRALAGLDVRLIEHLADAIDP